MWVFLTLKFYYFPFVDCGVLLFPLLAPETDLFGAPPFAPVQQDPFGMGDFSNMDLDNAIGEIDKRITEMRVTYCLYSLKHCVDLLTVHPACEIILFTLYTLMHKPQSVFDRKNQSKKKQKKLYIV